MFVRFKAFHVTANFPDRLHSSQRAAAMKDKLAQRELRVTPRLWHGHSTLPEEVKERGISLREYGIDPAHVARFRQFTRVVKD